MHGTGRITTVVVISKAIGAQIMLLISPNAANQSVGCMRPGSRGFIGEQGLH